MMRLLLVKEAMSEAKVNDDTPNAAKAVIEFFAID